MSSLSSLVSQKQFSHSSSVVGIVVPLARAAGPEAQLAHTGSLWQYCSENSRLVP